MKANGKYILGGFVALMGATAIVLVAKANNSAKKSIEQENANLKNTDASSLPAGNVGTTSAPYSGSSSSPINVILPNDANGKPFQKGDNVYIRYPKTKGEVINLRKNYGLSGAYWAKVHYDDVKGQNYLGTYTGEYHKKDGETWIAFTPASGLTTWQKVVWVSARLVSKTNPMLEDPSVDFRNKSAEIERQAKAVKRPLLDYVVYPFEVN